MEQVRVLVVEDEFITGSEIQARLEDLGYDVPEVVDTGKDAIAMVEKLHPQIVIMDITLKGEMNGIAAAEQIRKQFGIPVIYLTAHSDDATLEKAVTTEPFGYLIKPLEERALVNAIRMALYKHKLDQKLRESEKRYRAIAELAEDSIFICSRDYSVVFLNQYGRRFFGCQSEDAIGKALDSIIPVSLQDQLKKLIESVFSTRGSGRVTLSGMMNDTPIWLDTTLVPVFLAEDEVTEVIGHIRNITAMILLQREMEKKGIKQIEQNMEQFQILNDKIRNPLSIIMSIASMAETKESENIIEQVKKINNLVTQLDQGWIQSEAVRAFLLKHYGHGKEF